MSVFKETAFPVHFEPLRITSTAFQHKEVMPLKYTCDGDDVNPPLHIEHIPEDAKCLALIMDDPDAGGGIYVHWVVWNIPLTHHIRENEALGIQGINDSHQHQYGGPCPPSGTHRYYFKVYALDSLLDLPDMAGKNQLELAMVSHVLAYGELMGLYKRI